MFDLQAKYLADRSAFPLLAFRGCADDIGGALSSFKFLKIIKPVFDRAFRFAGLQLNPKKCVLIFTMVSDFEAQAKAIRVWLNNFLPEWANLKILQSHPYLGPSVGPSAGDSMWNKPIDKYWERVIRISRCGLSAYYSSTGL